MICFDTLFWNHFLPLNRSSPSPHFSVSHQPKTTQTAIAGPGCLFSEQCQTILSFKFKILKYTAKKIASLIYIWEGRLSRESPYNLSLVITRDIIALTLSVVLLGPHRTSVSKLPSNSNCHTMRKEYLSRRGSGETTVTTLLSWSEVCPSVLSWISYADRCHTGMNFVAKYTLRVGVAVIM